MSATKKPLRQAMPKVAEWIDACREAFGAETINRSIRNGLAGGTDFYAREGGNVIGCQMPAPGASFTADQLQIAPKRLAE